VDWADREATEAKVRAKIKRLLRRHEYRPPKPKAGGGGDVRGFDSAAQLVLDQAKALYRYWPDVEVGDQLFV
jgi:type I restriction enzyme R subunit